MTTGRFFMASTVRSHILIALIPFALIGCATQAPPYALSIPNVQSLKSGANGGVAVGEFTADGSNANNESISIRGNPLVSPHGTFSKYLQDALVQELTEARLLDNKSDLQISAVLLKNDISTGIGTASAEIEARFIVNRAGKTVYNKVKHAAIEWDSHFAAMVAIPRAQQNYPRLVSTLLTKLYEDNEFFTAIKKQ
jgi:hypothetical protein